MVIWPLLYTCSPPKLMVQCRLVDRMRRGIDGMGGVRDGWATAGTRMEVPIWGKRTGRPEQTDATRRDGVCYQARGAGDAGATARSGIL